MTGILCMDEWILPVFVEYVVYCREDQSPFKGSGLSDLHPCLYIGSLSSSSGACWVDLNWVEHVRPRIM